MLVVEFLFLITNGKDCEWAVFVSLSTYLIPDDVLGILIILIQLKFVFSVIYFIMSVEILKELHFLVLS